MDTAGRLLFVLFVLSLATPGVLAATNPLTDIVGGVGGFVGGFEDQAEIRFTGLLAIALFIVYLLLFQLLAKSFQGRTEGTSNRLINAVTVVLAAVLALFSAAGIPPAALQALRTQYQIVGFLILSLIPLAIIGGVFYLTTRIKTRIARVFGAFLLLVLASNLNPMIAFLSDLDYAGLVSWVNMIRLGLIVAAGWILVSSFGGERKEGSGGGGSGRGSNMFSNMVKGLQKDEQAEERLERGEKRERGAANKEYHDAGALRDVQLKTLADFDNVRKVLEAIKHSTQSPEHVYENYRLLNDLDDKLKQNDTLSEIQKNLGVLKRRMQKLQKDENVHAMLVKRDDRSAERLRRSVHERIKHLDRFENASDAHLAAEVDEYVKLHHEIAKKRFPELEHVIENAERYEKEYIEVIESEVLPALSKVDALLEGLMNELRTKRKGTINPSFAKPYSKIVSKLHIAAGRAEEDILRLESTSKTVVNLFNAVERAAKDTMYKTAADIHKIDEAHADFDRKLGEYEGHMRGISNEKRRGGRIESIGRPLIPR